MPSSPHSRRFRTSARIEVDQPLAYMLIQPGEIYWLPEIEQCDLQDPGLADFVIEYGCYNHPILVFASNRQTQMVLALIVSSGPRQQQYFSSNLEVFSSLASMEGVWRQSSRECTNTTIVPSTCQ